jgi:hypothetical protein
MDAAHSMYKRCHAVTRNPPIRGREAASHRSSGLRAGADKKSQKKTYNRNRRRSTAIRAGSDLIVGMVQLVVPSG